MIYWDTSYETGFADVDRQHHEILDTINQLTSSLNLGVRVLALTQLRQRAKAHFAYEEDLMVRYMVADEAHKADHIFLMTEIDRLIDDLPMATESKVQRECNALVRCWLIDHSLTKDHDLLGRVRDSMTPAV